MSRLLSWYLDVDVLFLGVLDEEGEGLLPLGGVGGVADLQVGQDVMSARALRRFSEGLLKGCYGPCAPW